MDVNDRFRTSLRAVSAVAFAVAASLFMTLAAVEIIRARFAPFKGFAPGAAGPALRYAFYAAAVAAVALIRFLPALRPCRDDPAVRQDDPGTAMARLQRISIVSLVLAETPGIAGFVLFLIGGFNTDFYILASVSLFLLFMAFPRRARWEERLGASGGGP